MTLRVAGKNTTDPAGGTFNARWGTSRMNGAVSCANVVSIVSSPKFKIFFDNKQTS